jgi:hypothetical protein
MIRDCLEVLFGLLEVILVAPVILAFRLADLVRPRYPVRRPRTREAGL